MLSLGDLFVTAIDNTPLKAVNPVLPEAVLPSAKTSDQGVSPAGGKRPAPFSIRLSVLDRARLLREAGTMPLGSYIKAKILGPSASASPPRILRQGISVKDQQALAQVVAILGRTRVFSNLNQLAHLANCGALPVSPDIEIELRDTLADIREMRRLLLTALGLKPDRSEEIAP